MNAIRILVVTLAAALPLSAFAAGGHGAAAPAATPFTQRRGAHLRGGAEQGGAEPAHQVRLHGLDHALCLSCHEESLEGRPGLAPVAGHMSHPYGLASVNSKVANVPADLLRGGRFDASAATTRTRRT